MILEHTDFITYFLNFLKTYHIVLLCYALTIGTLTTFALHLLYRACQLKKLYKKLKK